MACTPTHPPTHPPVPTICTHPPTHRCPLSAPTHPPTCAHYLHPPTHPPVPTICTHPPTCAHYLHARAFKDHQGASRKGPAGSSMNRPSCSSVNRPSAIKAHVCMTCHGHMGLGLRQQALHTPKPMCPPSHTQAHVYMTAGPSHTQAHPLGPVFMRALVCAFMCVGGGGQRPESGPCQQPPR